MILNFITFYDYHNRYIERKEGIPVRIIVVRRKEDGIDLRAGLGRFQDQGNRLRLRLLENSMITIKITFFLNVIDYDYIIK